MTDSVNGRSVYCVVTDKYGKTDKSKAVSPKKASDPLTITMQPLSTSAMPGDEVGLGIEVTGDVAPYTYQLKYTHNGINGWQDMESEILTIGTMTELTFCVTEQSLSEQFLYCILVTDANEEEVYSTVVHVDPLGTTDEFEIVTQPQNYTAQVGETASFTVAVEGGDAPYTYQWQYSSNNMNWTNIAGWADGKTDTLTFTVYANEFEHNYIYRCQITDAKGNTCYSDEVCVVQE